MKSENKIKALFASSQEKITQSLEDFIPEEFKDDHFRMAITLTHSSGERVRVGLCRCRDEDGNFQWMDCRKCPQ